MTTFLPSKPNLLRLALVFATASSGSAIAQTNIEEILVSASPIRDSQLAALEAKRNAENYAEMISADTIGRFPDQNLADSLGRLPGLAIERDQGQARYINLRGAPFRYTSIAFDGIDVPGAENGRIPRFDAFPSVITSRVDANKAILPSMPGESVAGFIDIRTFNPFDTDGFSFAGDLGMGEQQLGGGDVDKISLRASWSNENWGVLAFASENSRDQVTDNREYDLEIDNGGNLVVNELDYRSYFVTRSDEGRGAHIEYRGDDLLDRLFVSTLYSEFTDDEERNQWVFDMGGAVGETGAGIGVAVERLLEDGQYQNSTNTSTVGVDLMPGDWQVELRYNQTETEFMMDLPIPRSVGTGTLADYDLSDIEDPILTLAQPLDTLTYAMTIGIHYIQALDVNADKFKLDASRDLNLMGTDTTMSFGLQLDQREAAGYIATPLLDFATLAGVDIQSFDTGTSWSSNTTNSIGGTYFDNAGLRQAWENAGGLSVAGIGDANLVNIDEEITAYYAMATSRFDWGSLTYGARLEQTDYTSAGTNNGTAVSIEDSFTNFLPSAHLNVNLSEDIKWRLSASTGVNRPTYNEWRVAASVDVANQEVSGGNPALEAEEARGLDTAFEWYFAPASLLSVGAFTRSIDNVIYADSQTVDGGLFVPSEAGVDYTYTGTVNGSDGNMTGIELGFTGHADDYLPDVFTGFGVTANLTRLNSEFTAQDGTQYDLPGTSDTIYNFSLFYENYGLSARVNYQFRDEWISPIEDPSEYWGEQKRVDLSVSYELPTSNMGFASAVYLNANNLTNETDLRYAGNGTVNQSESYGRRWLAGVRVNF